MVRFSKLKMYAIKNQAQQLKEHLYIGSTCVSYLQELITVAQNEFEKLQLLVKTLQFCTELAKKQVNVLQQ